MQECETVLGCLAFNVFMSAPPPSASPPDVVLPDETTLVSSPTPIPSTGFSARHWGFIFALLGAVGFSAKGILAKMMFAHGVDAVVVIFWRMLMALPLFILMVWWGGRGRAHIPGSMVGRVMVLGFFGYYLASFLDFIGLQYISVALERLILALSPTLVLLGSWLILKKKFSRWQALAMFVSYLGVVVTFAHEMQWTAGSNIGWGAILVFLSAASYAIYLSGSGELVQRFGAMRLVGWASSIACFLCIVQGLVLKGPAILTQTPTPVLWLSLFNALFCTVIPMLMVMMGVARLGSTTAAQVGMIGPMLTVGLGVWLLNEPLTIYVVIGTILVLIGVAMLATPGRTSR